MRYLMLICIGWLMLAPSALAEGTKRYASIVVDANTHEIIHARQIDDLRYPASLTKLMTLYLTFEALDARQIGLYEPLKISQFAANTPPGKIGLRAGRTINTEEAILALTVRSANDASVVLAERLAGSETTFSEKMTEKARELKMQKTIFKTSHGLPHPQQVTTARDMAKLANALMSHYPHYYHYFSRADFQWGGRTYQNTNRLLKRASGVDGLKTGYTQASGYNLVISAQRDNRRLIAVVLGGASGESRDKHMEDLIERGFQTLSRSPQKTQSARLAYKSAEPTIQPVQKASYKTPTPTIVNAVRLRGLNQKPVTYVSSDVDVKIPTQAYDTSWNIQVGTYKDKSRARRQIEATLPHIQAGIADPKAHITQTQQGGTTLYRARFVNLTAHDAQKACKSLSFTGTGCLVIAPGSW